VVSTSRGCQPRWLVQTSCFTRARQIPRRTGRTQDVLAAKMIEGLLLFQGFPWARRRIRVPPARRQDCAAGKSCASGSSLQCSSAMITASPSHR
jgi:hypothetical protein